MNNEEILETNCYTFSSYFSSLKLHTMVVIPFSTHKLFLPELNELNPIRPIYLPSVRRI